MDNKVLMEFAKKASKKAYVPYSKFPVGAAVLCDDNKVYTGCNIENASYGLTNCAERTAIFKAISEGAKKIKEIAIYADTKEHIMPCGACRQVFEEFNPDMIVICGSLDGTIIVNKADVLLPGAFDKKYL